MNSLTLYYRRNCALCEEMLAELNALYGSRLRMRLVDVDTDTSLQSRYGLQVPVLTDGTVVLSAGRLDRSSLEDYVNSH